MPAGPPLIDHASPNFGDRRGGVRPHLIVLHHTAMDTCAAARDRLCDPEAEVSAHYLIDADGTILRLVAEEKRAWHAGAGQWGGCTDVNSVSIGIELDNQAGLAGFPPFPAAQMRALVALLPGIMARWQIGPAAVIAHSDMAPGRKADPGPKFDWRALAHLGLSIWPDGQGAADETPIDAGGGIELSNALRRFGYPVGGGQMTADDPVLQAFRLRFAPGRTGPPCRADLKAADALARAHPAIDPGARSV
ncbi:N-acetylmuramoyl-L-alanine amidase [Oceanomicrobium pacificus]|uniref:N-acetylmuramoyl-L-alanine amidase n=1 Tax=Oceanomicrobium pacificus TaxID=2692916 RepID=A0A6B0TW73_9RHOB|nr:N-acetylmuramoyl-L-alanine amidase [Oceanomicrobium pacificus]MXU65414.1 N-acetylmuramoyl-L-alanine amidase [Oceanomicrobium pacificus]